jgi:hypothetical protein
VCMARGSQALPVLGRHWILRFICFPNCGAASFALSFVLDAAANGCAPCREMQSIMWHGWRQSPQALWTWL